MQYNLGTVKYSHTMITTHRYHAFFTNVAFTNIGTSDYRAWLSNDVPNFVWVFYVATSVAN